MHKKNNKYVSGSILIEVIIASFIFLGISTILYKTIYISHIYSIKSQERNKIQTTKNNLIKFIKYNKRIPNEFDGYLVNKLIDIGEIDITSYCEFLGDFNSTICEIIIPNSQNLQIKYLELF